jgi:hypothetical protein
MKTLILGAFFVLAITLSVGFSAQACEGHYETRYETVLVSDGHYESRWVGPVRAGYGYIAAHYESSWVPPRYATRQVSVFVSDNKSSNSSSKETSFSVFKDTTLNFGKLFGL